MASAAPDPAALAERAFASPALAERELQNYLAADRSKPLLRFVTCGSVDDGKSTLIGRLLYDSKRLFQDQLAALESDSRRFGTQGQNLDFALLVDGLSAEREQGITIDVAYRFFASDTRKFIVADAPGHEQYTRNMATAASTADLAIILIDATQGVLPQTRRHSHIVRLLGVRHVVLAVNKMDLVGHDRDTFERIVDDYAAFAADAGIHAFTPIPLSALTGDNVTRPGLAMRWYDGPTLIEALELAPVVADDAAIGFALPVQRVNRPDAGFRGFSGTVASGSVAPGDRVAILPGGQTSTVARIVTFDGDLSDAHTGQAVTLVLADQVECAAGSIIAAAASPLPVGDRMQADLIWFDERPHVPNRRYLLQSAGRQTPARATVEREIVIDGAPPAAGVLVMNGIAAVAVLTDTPIAALPYGNSRALGAFVLIDRESHATVAAGMIRAVGSSADDARRKAAPVYAIVDDPAAANHALSRLRTNGSAAALLDETGLRAELAADLPDGPTDEFWRRTVAVARLLSQAGVTVVLTVPPPAGTPPFGEPWPGDEPIADWVI